LNPHAAHRPLPLAFWTNPEIGRMSKQAQGLAAWLLTNPLRSGVTLADLAGRMKLKPAAIKPLFKELEVRGLAWLHNGEVKLTGLARIRDNDGSTPP